MGSYSDVLQKLQEDYEKRNGATFSKNTGSSIKSTPRYTSALDKLQKDYEERQKKKKHTDIAPVVTVGSLSDDFDPNDSKENVMEKILSGLKTGVLVGSNYATTGTLTDKTIKQAESMNNGVGSAFSGYLQKGALENGVNTDSVSKAILGTGSDFSTDLTAGALGIGEGVMDSVAAIAPSIQYAQNLQNGVTSLKADEMFRNQLERSKTAASEFVKKDIVDEQSVAKSLLSGIEAYSGMTAKLQNGGYATIAEMGAAQQEQSSILDYYNNHMEADSVLAEKADELIKSGGQLLGTSALAAMGIPADVVIGLTSFGGETENALNNGATLDEAAFSGLVSAGAEILTEKFSGGIKFGGKTLDDAATKWLARNVSSKVGRTLAKLGMDMAGEGLEEVAAGLMSAIGQKMSYMSEAELKELFTAEDAWDSFIGGALMGIGGSVAQNVNAKLSGVDAVTGLTKNEQAVVDKVYQNEVAKAEEKGKVTEKEKSRIYDRVLRDMEKGNISSDYIESVLGGNTFEQYKKAADSENAILEEYETLGKKKDATLEERARYDELRPKAQEMKAKHEKGELESQKLKAQLTKEVIGMTKGDRLAESYNQRAKQSQKFEADLSQYDEKYRATVQRAIDADVFNNTAYSHEMVEFAAKLEAETGMTVDFTNNKKLKDSVFAVDGKNIHGYKTNTGVTINVDSPRYLETTVGHEITHVLEGTEAYNSLSELIKNYAITKEGLDGYNARVKAIEDTYKGVENANAEAEVVSDLVGEYLFSDTDFINNLSVENRDVFQKIWDEIKHLCKLVTAGSKQERQLEQVKKAFEDAYRTAKNTTEDGGVKYAISKDVDGNVFVDVTEDIFDANDGESVARTIQKVIAERFHNLIDVHGQKIQINKTTNDEFRRSNSANGVLAGSAQAYTDKLRTIANADEILSAAKNWIGEAKKHQRKDDIVEFARANVMYRVGENGYLADVLVGTRKNGAAVLYDLVNIYEKKITEAPVTMASDSRSQRRQDASAKQMLPQTRSDVKHQYSLSDSDGNKLTNEQQEYFKDSKVRDENGNLKVMYHGTPNGDFTVFKDGTYFTENKEYADTYQNPGASSISTGKAATNPKTFEVYLDIKKPFDINDAEARNIYINDYIKGGNAMGINPYLSDAEYAKIDTIDWTEGEDLREFLIDNGYDYDGLVLDEGGTGGYGDDVKSRGKSYVVFSPEQVKNVDNLMPTSNPDIRYSLSNMDDIGPVSEAIDKNAAYTDMASVNPAATAMGNVANTWKGRMDAAVDAGDEEDFWDSMNRYNEAWEDMNRDFAPVPGGVKQAEINRNVERKIQNIDRRLRQDKEALDEEYRERRADIEASITRADAKQAELANLDSEYQQEIAELERTAAEARENAKISTQRKIKQGEYTAEIAAIAGDTSTWADKKLGLSYRVNTLRRNLRDTVRDAEGNRDIAKADALYNYLQGSYNHNEAELNRRANKLKKKYAEMNINKYEDVYIQMLGEFRANPDTKLTEADVTDYYNQHKSKIDAEKVDRVIDMARKDYDELFAEVNEVLTEQGMRPLEYRKGYFPHFTEPKQGPIAKLLNWKVKDDSIPTDIAGLTEMFNPTRSWQSFNKQRKTDVTDYSFMKGFDRYSFGALDWVYHIEDLNKRRAFENYIRYVHSEKGVQERIDKVKNSDQYDASEVQDQIDNILKEAKNPLNNFVTDLRKGTNTLAGKKSSLDREMEYSTNRKFYSTMSNLSNRVNANMVGGSISSALTNFIPITQSWGQVNPVYSVQAIQDTMRSALRDDGTINKSDFLTNRLNSADNLYQTGWDKINDKVSWLMDAVDSFTSQTVWRSKYLQNMNEGMSEVESIKDADQFAENVMAGRSRGNMPTVFDAKNPIVKMATAFQLEVNNQYGYMFKDMPQDMANECKLKLAAGYVKMFVGAYAYNALSAWMTGRDAAFDPFRIIQELLGDLYDEEEEEMEVLDAGLNLFDNVLDELPFISGLTGGGRIPISSALPYDGLYEAITGTAKDFDNLDWDAFKERDWKTFTADADWKSLTSEWLNPAFYLLAPVGGGQIRKTMQGLSMFSDEHPVAGSYTDSGSLRFDVEDTPWNRVQAAVFGQWANKNAQEYIDEGLSPLNEEQVDQMVKLGFSADEYRTYMAGISEAGKTTDDNGYQKYLDDNGNVYWYDKDNLTVYDSDYNESETSILSLEKASATAAKVEYISNLPISTEQKNILYKDAANQSLTDKYGFAKYTGTQVNEDGEVEEGDFFYDSKRDIWYDDDYAPIAKSEIEDLAPVKEWDMSDYNEYDNYEEFDYAQKNPEKYQFLQDCGISYQTYSKDGATTAAYDWAYKYPDLYAFSKAVNEDLVEYREQYTAMKAIKSDYDSNGKAIKNSRKYKIIEYLNTLDLDIGAKALLLKSEYSSEDSYNDEILEYLNGLDMTFAEKKSILEYLGAKVGSDGRITWD